MGMFAQTLQRADRTGVPLLVARLFVGGMFAYLSYQKLVDPLGFLKQVHEYGIFPTQPPELINTLAIIMPWLEMFCAVALLLGVFVRGAGTLVFGMLLFFAPLLLWRAWSEYGDPANHFATFCAVKFDCGCGTGEVFICRKMLENTSLQIAALIPMLTGSRRWCLAGLFTRRKSAEAPAAG